MEAIMEKLTIKEASQQFGLSRTRVYQLLREKKLQGYLSDNHAGGSWVNLTSLKIHLGMRDKKWGRPKVLTDNNEYMSVKDASQKTGYSTQHIYLLIKKGSIGTKQGVHGQLILYSDLLRHKEKQ